jgi:DNA-binding IclR family transcriptional regulator
MDTTSPASTDAGSIERALRLVRLLATAGGRGLALTEAARRARLPHGTAHRLLHRLIGEGLVQRISSTRRYALGPLAFELGLAASIRFDIRSYCRPILARLAERVDDTVYLTTRSGLEAVCADRFEGRSPIRVLELEVGSRRPLGLGAGGLAILAAFEADEREDIIERLVRSPESATRGVPSLAAAAVETRRRGYALVHDRVTRGVTAVGVPIRNSLHVPAAAVSVAAIHERMPTAKIKSLAMLLRTAAGEIERSLLSQAHEVQHLALGA